MNKIFKYYGTKRVIYIETNSSKNKYLKEMKLEKKRSDVIANLKDKG
jgi:hypothetical protein